MYTILFSLPLPLPQKNSPSTKSLLWLHSQTHPHLTDSAQVTISSSVSAPSHQPKVGMQIPVICDIVWGTPLKTNMTIFHNKRLKMYVLVKRAIFRGYVSYQEGKYFFGGMMMLEILNTI